MWKSFARRARHCTLPEFEKALEHYNEWASACPDDPAPLSNISVVQYQLGHYDATIEAVDRALKAQEDAAKRQALLLRKTHSLLYLKNFEATQQTAELLDESPERAVILQRCQVYTTLLKRNVETLHQKLITKLPRYRPSILVELEYFYFGHDDPTSLFDETLAASTRQSSRMLFGGIGDARHLFKTVARIGETEGLFTTPKQYHLAIVDISATVIARILVFLLILSDAANGKEEEGDVPGIATKSIHCLYYAFLAPIMPPELYEILQSNIRLSIDILEGRSTMPSILNIAPTSTKVVLQVLKRWQGEVPSKYPTRKIRTAILGSVEQHVRNLPGSEVPADMKKDVRFYYKSALLVANHAGEVYPPVLQQLYQPFNNSSAGPSASVLQQVDLAWKPNVTMIDPDVTQVRDLSHDPLDFGERLVNIARSEAKSTDGMSLYEAVHAFFTSTSDAIHRLGSRLTIEGHVGDVNFVLESLQHPDTATMPDGNVKGVQSFDRIVLSNIPDYTGGTLTTLTYALPCLYPDNTSSVSFNCLRNTGLWHNTEHYNAEYLSLGSLSEVQQAFKVLPIQKQENDGAMDSDFMSMFMPGIPNAPVMYGLALQEYQAYARMSLQSSPGTSNRERLEQWLFRLFLKLAFPKDRSSQTSPTEVFNPLNLTAFIRLCAMLGNTGYPGHWLDGVLISIRSGNITSRARAPRSSPLTCKEILTDVDRSEMVHSTKPFVAEMTTLVALWQHTFPFATLCPGIPSPAEVHTYQCNVQPYSSGVSEKQVLMLALVQKEHHPGSQPGRLRKLLLSDEEGVRTKNARIVKENIHLISTCNIEHGLRNRIPCDFSATFWMRSDVIEGLRSSGKWFISIWRTDEWSPASGLVPLSKVRDMGSF